MHVLKITVINKITKKIVSEKEEEFLSIWNLRKRRAALENDYCPTNYQPTKTVFQEYKR